ncbi:MAG: DMT family transporter [Eubacteriales bacterium]|nr:DMT family transporter [Eubacteriales bacterium]
MLIISAIMWGISFISIKIAMTVFPPMSLAFYRFLLASIILYPIMKKIDKKEALRKKDIPLVALAGILGITVYFFFENNGLLRISANDASIIIAMLPVGAAICERVFLKKKLKLISLAAIIASVFGIYMVIGGELRGGNPSGYWYMLGAIISYSIYLILTKPLFDRYSDITVAFYQSLFGCVAFIPFLFFETVRWDLLNTTITLNFFFLAVLCSAVASYFYMYALNHLGVSIAAVFMNLIPVVTFIASFIIFGQTMTFIQIIGAVVVIGAVTVVTRQHETFVIIPENQLSDS